MSASSPHKAPHELRTLVKDYLVTEDFPDGWVEPEEISDQAAPDLILARELWSLIEQLEAKERELQDATRMVAALVYRANKTSGVLLYPNDLRENLTLSRYDNPVADTIHLFALNPASSPSKAAGGWCERHGGYLGQRCATCALEVADSAPASRQDA